MECKDEITDLKLKYGWFEFGAALEVWGKLWLPRRQMMGMNRDWPNRWAFYFQATASLFYRFNVACR